ncbi:flagellar hook-associated protein FlgK [Roseburia inulinivorans]|jgi:flagellar hook-associated protein 1 FlgK|uniref:Flagellar hook-associated protein 1 n=1 Tax=Roseburia inulinivorans TaxID=360807 RepID=A0A3R5ZQK7_9FIRM|nr:flagellar hook-associated protein FlgK [Roseburia inulinivorans]RGR67005.1 flagellar hook-associated protein FlgK [Roseburia inulinivorans]
MPSQFFGLTIASSGLSAYQAALNTTANNISNEQTKGYSRQAANLSASDALRVNAKYGSMGSGVTVNSIKQIRSEYYDTKYWQNQASLGLYETKLGYLEQIENYFIDDDTEKGFSTILNKMFNSLDTLTHPAGDTNVRQQFISDAQSFMTYFNSVATGLGQIQDSVNEEIKSTVENINAIGKKISLLNKQINVIEVQGGYANELRDQRALLIDELSSIVPTEVSEVPVTNSKHPDMQTGANYYTVKINGQKFVDTYEYSELTCVARKNTINQSDREGMYEIVWADTGNSFKAGSDSSSGSLKALFDIRDGNNSENFRGSIKGVTAGTITISNPSITNVNAMTMPAEGVLTIDGKNYNYTDFTFTTDADGNVKEYTFTLENQLSSDQQAKLDGKQASIGESIDAMGVPYYLAQMNEFLRNFAGSFNDIMNSADAKDLNGNSTDYFSFFTGTHTKTGEEYVLSNAAGVYSAKASNSYYQLTCGNACVSNIAVKDPTTIATTTTNAADAYDLVEKMLKLKSDTELYRGGGADDFLECMYSDISVDSQKSKIFQKNYSNISNAIDKQRMSVSGVDKDEEAIDLVKFQNAYNLSSKMVSVLAEIYDKLINETGV